MVSERINVLLIEDNPGDARLVQEYLREGRPARFELEWRDTLAKGLARLSEGGVHAVLLDLSLPDGHGLDTLLKVESEVPEAPVVVLTGLDDEITAVEAVKRGAQDYLVKGHFQGDVLPRAISYAIERKRVERELKTARDQALDAVRLKSAFLANMSHEIRTPLNVILGYNSIILQHLEDIGDETQRPLVDVIHRAAQRLMGTIHGILDLSRIESGAFEPNAVPNDLATMVERLVQEMQVIAREKGVSLTLAIDEPTAAVLFDEYCLSHAILNLVQNAIKFTEAGGRVEVRVRRDPAGSLCLDVSDTGVGIDRDYLPHLFEPFSQEQVGRSRSFEGAGLGLALVKRFLEMNGAGVSVISEKGKGTTFTVFFSRSSETRATEVIVGRPLGATVSHSAVSRPLPPAPAYGPDERRPAILVVEDDPETQAYMKALLGKRYDVMIAASADEARRSLTANPGRVKTILMDLSLKGSEDGVAFTRSLRREEPWRRVPVIAVTAHALPEDRRTALAAGCDAYVTKPFDRWELLSMIGQFSGSGTSH